MEFTLALAQCVRPQNDDVIAEVKRWTQEAAKNAADLIVFPEALMAKYDGSIERFMQQAQPADGAFAQSVDAIAAEEGLWIAYTINEQNEDGGLPYNTAVITDASGKQRARYRKVHLFDAQGHRESERITAGDKLLPPVEALFATVGLGICYDLRFPEVALAAALEGAQLMLYPAAWVAGPGKAEQWETLLCARAIENGMFVAGCCRADEDCVGHSCVFGPDGRAIVTSNGDEQLVVCTVDLAEIDRVRAATPSLQHRRPDCYHR